MHANYQSLATLAVAAYAALSSLGCTQGAASSSIPQSLGSQAIPAAASRAMVSGLVVRPAEWVRERVVNAAPRPFGQRIGDDEELVLEALVTSVRTPSGAIDSVSFPVEGISGGKAGFNKKHLAGVESQINGSGLKGPGTVNMYEKFGNERNVCLAVYTIGGTAVGSPRIAELAKAKAYFANLSDEYVRKVAGDYMRRLGFKDINSINSLPPEAICDLYFAATDKPTPTPQATSTPQPAGTPQPGATPQQGASPQAGQPQGGIIAEAQKKFEEAKKALEDVMNRAQQPGAATPSTPTPEPVPPTPTPTQVPQGTQTSKGVVTDYNKHLTGGVLWMFQSDTIDFKLEGLEIRIEKGQRGFDDAAYSAVQAFLQQAQADGACVEANYDVGPTPKQVTSPQALTLCPGQG